MQKLLNIFVVGVWIDDVTLFYKMFYGYLKFIIFKKKKLLCAQQKNLGLVTHTHFTLFQFMFYYLDFNLLLSEP